MAQNLTAFQQKLVDDLINEFTKINPKPIANGTKRFTFDTIAECNKEQERFIETIKKNNLTMMKVFINQFNDEIKAFKKEFGKVLDIQIGYSSYNNNHHTFDNFVEQNNEKPLANNNFNEMFIFLVSKTKPYTDSDNRWNYCKGMKYHKIYADFKREYVKHKLESGKEVYAFKIIGFQYSTSEYLHRDRDRVITTSTLDELIQTDKNTQTKIVELAS
jgi:hypothetical protein